MNYQRILLLTELDVDPAATFAAISRFAPSARRIIVVAQQSEWQFAWLTSAAPSALSESARGALDRLRHGAERLAADVDVALASELTAESLADAVAAALIDLMVVDSRSGRLLGLLRQLRKRVAVPALIVPSSLTAPVGEPGHRLLCIAPGTRGRRAVLKYLREQTGPADRVVLLQAKPLNETDLKELREVCGIAPELQLSSHPAAALTPLLGIGRGQGFDLIVLTLLPPLLPRGVPAPALLVLPLMTEQPSERERGLDVPDLVDDGRLIRARAEYAVGLGRRTAIADQELAFVRQGRIVARTTTRQGDLELPSGLGDSLGLFRTDGRATSDPLLALEEQIAVLQAGARPIILFDAEIEEQHWPLIRSVTWADALAVRLRPMRSFKSLRTRLRAGGLAPRVIDARTVMAEGEAADVPPQADAARLARVATHMRADGFAVAAIIYRGPLQPATQGFAAVPPEQVTQLVNMAPGSAAINAPAERFALMTASQAIGGNSISIELDNPTARGWLLSAIESSHRRVHFQVYMAADDDVGAPIEAALARAAARGVKVRMLVDSLHGLHGSFGLRNPLLERLASHPGVELCVSKPISAPASLEDVKQRDHRKLVVADGEVALLGGRNLSHEYYAGFDEVALTPAVTWRTVPWLDAGARVQGPIVAALERSFLQAWTLAGGEQFEIQDGPPTGSTNARLVVHHGLRDAYTLEAYLALIDEARSHIYAVNGFPLLLEMQHALLRALRRGVRVRTLVGNLTPKHGAEPFKGPWATARTLATSFVHSRLDASATCARTCTPRR
jgi:hypothetical protein